MPNTHVFKKHNLNISVQSFLKPFNRTSIWNIKKERRVTFCRTSIKTTFIHSSDLYKMDTFSGIIASNLTFIYLFCMLGQQWSYIPVHKPQNNFLWWGHIVLDYNIVRRIDCKPYHTFCLNMLWKQGKKLVNLDLLNSIILSILITCFRWLNTNVVTPNDIRIYTLLQMLILQIFFFVFLQT